MAELPVPDEAAGAGATAAPKGAPRARRLLARGRLALSSRAMSDRPRAPYADPDLEARRRQTLAELESLHGTRAIGAEEYRRRAEVARRARDVGELEAVRPDPPVEPAAPASRPAPARQPADPRDETGDDTGFVFACMGGSIRKGPWEPPEKLYALSLMGGIQLDFRDAALLEGTSEVRVLAVMGGVNIVVPDDVDVEVNGIGLMGGFEHVSHHGPGEDRPLLRIKGLALMGGVTVRVKPAPAPSTGRRIARKLRDWV